VENATDALPKFATTTSKRRKAMGISFKFLKNKELKEMATEYILVSST